MQLATKKDRPEYILFLRDEEKKLVKFYYTEKEAAVISKTLDGKGNIRIGIESFPKMGAVLRKIKKKEWENLKRKYYYANLN